MKKLVLILILLSGLIVPLACTSNQPTGPLATYNLTATFTNTFTPTATNWAGYTSTPTFIPGTNTATPSVTKTPSNTATPTVTLTITPTVSVFTPVVNTTAWNTSAPPNGLAYTSSGSATVYVTEGTLGSTGGQVQLFSASGTALSSFTTYNGTTAFGQPNGVAINSAATTLYVIDQVNNALYAMNPGTGALYTALTSWTASKAGAPSSFNNPEGVAVDSNGIVYVADTGNDYVEVFNPSLSSTPVTEFGGFGNGNGYFYNPSGVAVTVSGGVTTVYVTDASNQLVQQFNNFNSTPGAQILTGSNSDIFGITLDASGNIYLADSGIGTGSGSVEEYKTTGIFETAGLGNSSANPDPVGVVVVGANLLVADYNNSQIYTVTP